MLATHLSGERTGLIDCWPLEVTDAATDPAGTATVLRIVKALATLDGVTPRLYLVTANAQPAAGTELTGTELTGVEQAAFWDSDASSDTRNSASTGAV